MRQKIHELLRKFTVILGGDDTLKSEKTCKFTDALSAVFFYIRENWVTIVAHSQSS